MRVKDLHHLNYTRVPGDKLGSLEAIALHMELMSDLREYQDLHCTCSECIQKQITVIIFMRLTALKIHTQQKRFFLEVGKGGLWYIRGGIL